MSHVAKIKAEIKDLEALKNACSRLNLIFKENQKSYKWFGRHVGDYPIPEGYSVKDMGKCDHAISVPGVAYEIGVVKSKTNPKRFDLMWDFWDGGLKNAMGGENAPKLVQAITIEQGKLTAKRKGLIVKEIQCEDKIRLVVNF